MSVPKLGNGATLKNFGEGAEVLGTIKDPRISDPKPQGHTATWTREDGTVIELTEPAPPWEIQDEKYAASDARRFVEVPPQWKLHWVNPRVLESEGWRDWQAIQASDHRVKVKVPSMVSPEGYIRRGGSSGDILAWMWQGWYESLSRKMRDKTDAQTQSAVDKQDELREDFKRGKYGPNVSLEDAKHPKFTQGEGRTMRD